LPDVPVQIPSDTKYLQSRQAHCELVDDTWRPPLTLLAIEVTVLSIFSRDYAGGPAIVMNNTESQVYKALTTKSLVLHRRSSSNELSVHIVNFQRFTDPLEV
jgi:hypothetical protein